MSKRSTLFLLIPILILIGSGTVYYSLRDNTSDELIPVRIGYQALAPSWAFYVANERLPGNDKSFFEEEGLGVEAVRFNSSNTAGEAMLRGDISTDSATTMTVLFAIEANHPGSLKCFGFQMHTVGEFLESVIVRKDSGAKTYSDLIGGKIGVFPGSLSEHITKILLKSNGVDPEEVTIIQMAPPLQLQALESGQVDALVSYEPTTTIALSKNIAEVIEHSPWAKHIFEPFPVASYCFTSNFLEQQPEVAQKIVGAWYKAIDYLNVNSTEAALTISKYTNVEPDLASLLNQPAQKKATEVDRAAIQRLANLYLEFGIIDKPVDTSNIYYAP